MGYGMTARIPFPGMIEIFLHSINSGCGAGGSFSPGKLSCD
jgi:hypothetical protein